jgi:anti-sigma regulatory factor (Ser/Thr protein kinase)
MEQGGSVTPVRLQRALSAEPSSVGEARQLVREMCDRTALEEQARDAAILLTSELVTNAVLHASGEVRLSVLAAPSSITVEVGDDSPRHPVPRHAAPGAVNGRGLGIVEACASSWGVRDEDPGKSVWFEIRTD